MNAYERARKESFEQLEKINNCPDIGKTLNFSLPNSSEKTDYDAWREGSKKFANDNFELLREWIK